MTWTAGEKVTLIEEGERTTGVVRVVVAASLLRIELSRWAAGLEAGVNEQQQRTATIPSCCQRLLHASPQEGDTALCPCGLSWMAHTAPHVGVPTWWSSPRCPECNGRKVVTDPWTQAEDRCPTCTENGRSESRDG